MKKRGNVICIILVVIILIIFGVFKYYNDAENRESEAKFDIMRQQYAAEIKAEEQEKAEKEAHYQAIREDIPGIVCWGDDIVYGKGGIEKSFPFVLENLLEENEYQLPVYNMGVSGEDTLTVLGRQGAIPYIVDEFTIEDNGDITEISVSSSYRGEEVNPLLRKKNPGINPCSINGIEGTLYGFVLPAKLDKVHSFFFARSESGEKIDIPKGTEIVTSGNDYKDYVNILAIGENGGWNNNASLVDQNQRFVDFLAGSKNENSYLILGMTKGNADENEEIEAMMNKQFGEHYINIREYLSTNAMNDLGLEPTENDKEMMAEGRVPESLMFDENNLNDDAYEAIGRVVYNKLVEYNYIKK